MDYANFYASEGQKRCTVSYCRCVPAYNCTIVTLFDLCQCLQVYGTFSLGSALMDCLRSIIGLFEHCSCRSAGGLRKAEGAQKNGCWSFFYSLNLSSTLNVQWFKLFNVTKLVVVFQIVS